MRRGGDDVYAEQAVCFLFDRMLLSLFFSSTSASLSIRTRFSSKFALSTRQSQRRRVCAVQTNGIPRSDSAKSHLKNRRHLCSRPCFGFPFPFPCLSAFSPKITYLRCVETLPVTLADDEAAAWEVLARRASLVLLLLKGGAAAAEDDCKPCAALSPVAAGASPPGARMDAIV